jgi:meso-butanediol dehydrogenase/(S,S)-butanediol dehydrogenase/diacetyl reductase
VLRFDERVALVIGAGSGIGQATVVRLAAEGAAVVAVDVDAAGLARTAEVAAKEAAGPNQVTTQVGDVTDRDFAPALVHEVVERHGRLDVLANVAGILRTGITHEASLEDWDRVLSVNLTGTYLCCRAAIPALLDSGGNIVNVSSTSALAGHPWAAAYSASKGGVLALTRTIAVEYGQQGLRCNAVCPGSIDTPITQDFVFPEGVNTKLVRRMMALDRPRGPETVAAAIAFLASDDAAHVNGEHVRVDGATLS